MDNRPIGVFDSGVGGLTVVKEIISQLPNENIVYFGDTARVPYGTKSPETITRFSFQNIRFLHTQDIKAIVIACNTASALSLDTVKKEFDLPIIGVVQPGADAAVSTTRNKRVGVIGTQATITSKAYEHSIRTVDSSINVFSNPCPLFVPLVEEGWLDNEITYKTAEIYLHELREKEVDTLILGCTHYPLLINTIQDVVGSKVRLVNPAFETAKAVKNILIDSMSLRESTDKAEYKFFLSDIETKFEKIAAICLNQKINNIQKINIEQF